MTSKNFKYVISIAILLIVFLAYQDTVGFAMFQLSGGWAGDAYQKMEPKYMEQFWVFALSLIMLVGLLYYLFRRDLSETAAIFFVYYTLLFAGLEDVIYYILMGLPLDARMPWLDDNFFMGPLSRLLGFEGVTNISILISLTVGILVAYYGVVWLAKQEW